MSTVCHHGFFGGGVGGGWITGTRKSLMAGVPHFSSKTQRGVGGFHMLNKRNKIFKTSHNIYLLFSYKTINTTIYKRVNCVTTHVTVVPTHAQTYLNCVVFSCKFNCISDTTLTFSLANTNQYRIKLKRKKASQHKYLAV